MLKRLVLVALAAAGLGGCAVYPASPYYGGSYYGGYYSTPPVVVAPAPRPYYYGYPRYGGYGWRRW